MSHLPPEFRYLDGKMLSSRVYPEFFSLAATDRVLNAGFGDGPQAVVYRGSFASATISPSASTRACASRIRAT
jgi:hypothetical protein